MKKGKGNIPCPPHFVILGPPKVEPGIHLTAVAKFTMDPRTMRCIAEDDVKAYA